MKRFLGLLGTLVCLTFPPLASAGIDVTFDAGSFPGTTVTLGPGTYSGSWIGGGWSAWSSGDNWLNSFHVAMNGGPDLDFGAGSYPYYSTPEKALEAVKGLTFSFVVPTRQDVTFTVADDVFYDNRGGLTLSIAAVPEPQSFAMMMAGLALIAGIARRRASRS
jgi:hypothetical protein